MRASALAFGCLALEALGAIGATDHLVNLERVFKERYFESIIDTRIHSINFVFNETFIGVSGCKSNIQQLYTEDSSHNLIGG